MTLVSFSSGGCDDADHLHAIVEQPAQSDVAPLDVVLRIDDEQKLAVLIGVDRRFRHEHRVVRLAGGDANANSIARGESILASCRRWHELPGAGFDVDLVAGIIDDRFIGKTFVGFQSEANLNISFA